MLSREASSVWCISRFSSEVGPVYSMVIVVDDGATFVLEVVFVTEVLSLDWRRRALTQNTGLLALERRGHIVFNVASQGMMLS